MRCSDPEALVTSWLAVPSRQPEHPLVVEVGELAILALETGQGCVALCQPAAGRGHNPAGYQIASASSSNATASRRFVGSSTASS
jgi:hypothetical protein